MKPSVERLQTNEVLHDPRIVRLNEASFQRYRERMADLYYLGWTEQGLCPSREEAVSRIDRYRPEHTFVVFDNARQEVFGVLNTAPAQADDLLELCERFPTYRSVEAAGSEPAASTAANVRICFSVIVPHGLRMQPSAPGMASTSVAEFLLKHSTDPQQRTLAYSRFGNVPPDCSLADQYRSSQENMARSGAVGLHERFGGLTVALIDNARPEDELGGRGNVLVAYPMTEQEEQQFAAVRQRRRQGAVEVVRHGTITLFDDVSLMQLFG